MDQVKNHLTKAGSYRGLKERAGREISSEEQNRRGVISSDHPIWDVWQQIKDCYPGPTANWDDEPPAAWAFALDGVSKDAIAAGIKFMVHCGSNFPPSAPEFRKMCGSNTDWEHARLKPCHEVLEAPIVDKGEGRHLIAHGTAEDAEATPEEHLAKLKTIFG